MTSITSANVNNNNNDGTKKKLQMITCFCGDAFVDIQTSKMNNLHVGDTIQPLILFKF